jgi:hypothetical protein
MAEPGTRTTPAKLPAIPAAPVIPVPPPTAALPKPPGTMQPAGQFGTAAKPAVPPGVDEFDPAAFNRSLPEKK